MTDVLWVKTHFLCVRLSLPYFSIRCVRLPLGFFRPYRYEWSLFSLKCSFWQRSLFPVKLSFDIVDICRYMGVVWIYIFRYNCLEFPLCLYVIIVFRSYGVKFMTYLIGLSYKLSLFLFLVVRMCCKVWFTGVSLYMCEKWVVVVLCIKRVRVPWVRGLV